ncbi:uncharacterized protein FOMMEDRAFT_18560 [Fomitiporia mediterranea MF3/22]|uniref:uncharacterized protein n=1 Tax=Fomitiporia mediterranea (strain MF3/22) TaxID=694068 RepID=UPI00044081BE|nr:uncharacterized protein FOMMEDRAFT_18560 [Fomitiporia mediterranea MF3/22]EJD04832.1 hypothetical protein FOMMEDRAFT_18560 [Fomitiporia mediterranea MF3/22]
MDDLKDFLEQQQALAEMPEGDIDELEARMLRQAKRRNLWKADGPSASPSQNEREAHEFSTYLQSLAASEEVLHGLTNDDGGSYNIQTIGNDRPSVSREATAISHELRSSSDLLFI